MVQSSDSHECIGCYLIADYRCAELEVNSITMDTRITFNCAGLHTCSQVEGVAQLASVRRCKLIMT